MLRSDVIMATVDTTDNSEQHILPPEYLLKII